MRTSSCPGSHTLGDKTKTVGPAHGKTRGPSVRAFSVSTALPAGLAVLLCLSTAAPGAASDGDASGSALGSVRVELAALRAGMETLRQEASEKIEHYEAERERLTELTERSREAQERAGEADERGETARLAAARQAATAYKGGELGMVNAWAGPEGPTGMLERGAYLTLLGSHREADVGRAEAARVATDTLAGIAETARTEQAEAVEDARSAREDAVEAVADQEAALEELLEEQTRLEARLAEVRDAEAAERRREEALRDARAANSSGGSAESAVTAVSAEEQEGGEEAPSAEGADRGCTGGVATAHANGRIPESVLCPLPQPGERLRADAAEAFIELDGDYREAFGRPMCVADSYRPYHEQVRLFQEMVPGMAARPGTSQHGLGLAVDLCGGVNRLGTAEHQWMLAHAPEHGWHNPPWARGGFEPWHWEFTP
ncbi:D-alanyl-D-alanine carboxypeptidase [Nocardiopsis dassonvillei]|uniref:Peptidase M15B and M15C DD-carboxypeptidase VanY/endolysin n=1 Tax=Nocardiopsis dassonvillei (strain ATCC 23218 / DSM 43111 / CIP 107115 / JCM 7437 / KCTC 9190 / NBRC 14626 / NCTC 10488 / NRRL B-5397 / IMRU 509) TaxID=446468 RepID=D7AZG4_NOCDD|nr:peptidase M15B and M15C DD-carboxypeptidase VanY/endolysin [Nocardiopsis dassonvillei subsp. dassonvillei DSM 43111]VEI92278.1 D-alanyl-D-alanine carboxypeptidase [Nocardiopsis dassonvillei]